MLTPGFLKELAKIVGRDNVLSAKRDLLAYSYDATQHQEMPEVVIFPTSAAEISQIMKLAKRQHMAVIPRGAGTGISGGAVPLHGGIILELSRMNRIIALDTANRRAIAEPGVVNLDLQDALVPLGFIYPPDPASQKSCTLGGNVGENAGGPLCFRYGVTSKYVTEIDAVLPTGEIVEFGGEVEDVPGYDLRGLFIGSEGTLGTATKLTLQILPAPEARITMLAVFNTLDDAGQSVAEIIRTGMIPAALELMDKPMCGAIEESINAGYPTDAEGVLLIEVAGVSEGLERQAQQISEICRRNHVRELRFAQNAGERDGLWSGRKGAFGSIARICPHYLVNDGTVPRSQLVPALRMVGEISTKYHVRIANVAHAGDGNLHPLIVYDRSKIEETTAARQASQEILDACIDLGGTISGEHGIGIEKLAAMSKLFSAADLAAMRKVKQVFDPDGILNPGKLLPEENKEVSPVSKETIGAKEVTKETLAQKFNEIVGPSNLITGSCAGTTYCIDDLAPKSVVYPTNADQIAQILRTSQQAGATVVPWGSGSRQHAGPCLASADTVLCLEHLDQIDDFDIGNCSIRVGAGKTKSDLQNHLRQYRLFFPPGSMFADTSTIGGMLATNASGPERLMYGTPRDLVLGLTAVTPDGNIIHAGGKTMKNVAGLDMCRLFIGSWGTLGVITEAVLRLFPLPEASQTVCLVFSGFEDTFRLVGEILNSALTPCAMAVVDAVASYHLGDVVPGLDHGETLLMISCEGSQEIVQRHVTEINDKAATRARARVRLIGPEADAAWSAYGGLEHSLLPKTPARLKLKASVPLTKMAKMCLAARETGVRYGSEVGLTAHSGNGIVYVYAAVHGHAINFINDLRQAAISCGGLLTVEAAPLEIRRSVNIWPRPSTYSLMQKLKMAFDPGNILNRGKLFGGQQ